MLDFIINILSTPAILVGLLALIGLALQKKPIEEITKGNLNYHINIMWYFLNYMFPQLYISLD